MALICSQKAEKQKAKGCEGLEVDDRHLHGSGRQNYQWTLFKEGPSKESPSLWLYDFSHSYTPNPTATKSIQADEAAMKQKDPCEGYISKYKQLISRKLYLTKQCTAYLLSLLQLGST